MAVVYHFFAHYRAPIIGELSRFGAHDYCFVGDVKGLAGEDIRAADGIPPDRFARVKNRWLLGRYLFQWGVLRHAVRRDLDALVFLADPRYLTTWMAAILARLTRKRVYFWTHGWTRDDSGLRDWVRRLYFRLAHGLLVYGHWAKQMGIRRGFQPDRLHVVYNSLAFVEECRIGAGLSEESLAQARAELFADPQRPLLVCCARLIKQRRLGLLLDAMTVLRAAGHEANLLLIGDGPERAALDTAATEMGLVCRFIGACYDAHKLARYVSAADATVIPASAGLSVIQSLTFGTPVITNDDWQNQGPEAEAIVPGKSGGLFRAGDAHDLARAITDCISQPGGRAQRRKQCVEIVERFYNPRFQRRVIDRAVSGLPADDLFWQREPTQTTYATQSEAMDAQ